MSAPPSRPPTARPDRPSIGALPSRPPGSAPAGRSPTAHGSTPVGHVELAPGFRVAGSGTPPPTGPAGATDRRRRRPVWTFAWIGIVAAAVAAGIVALVVVNHQPSDGTAPGRAGTGQTTGQTTTGQTAAGSAVPADPGWPPSRIPTSLLPPSAAPSIGPKPSAAPTGTADPAGGVVAARTRVAGFVAALNDDDPARANAFLCRAMAGAFGADMLNGIAPGTVGVGGVTTSGGSGTAYITYQPTGGGDPQQSKFGLVVEGGQWMVCPTP